MPDANDSTLTAEEALGGLLSHLIGEPWRHRLSRAGLVNWPDTVSLLSNNFTLGDLRRFSAPLRKEG